MTQASCPLSPPVTLDYENTLVLAIELSKTKWVLSAQVPGLLRVKAKQTIEPKAEALLAAIDGYRNRSRAAGRTLLAWLRGEPRVCSMVPIPDEADEDERRRV